MLVIIYKCGIFIGQNLIPNHGKYVFFVFLLMLHIYGKIRLIFTIRQRSRNSSRGRVKNFHFSISFRLAVGPTQPPNQ
jgi:hypothetical protein